MRLTERSPSRCSRANRQLRVHITRRLSLQFPLHAAEHRLPCPPWWRWMSSSARSYPGIRENGSDLSPHGDALMSQIGARQNLGMPVSYNLSRTYREILGCTAAVHM